MTGSRLSPTRAGGLFVLIVAAVALSPAASAQCLPNDPCTKGSWSPPWEWNSYICACYCCPNDPPIEFYQGALIPVGRHAGKIVLLRSNNNGPQCTGTNEAETWVWSPDSPSTLTRVNPGNPLTALILCSAHSWDRDGKLVIAGGVATGHVQPIDTFRFDPNVLGVKQFPFVPIPPPACLPAPFIDAPNCWVPVGPTDVPRYYPTVFTLSKLAIQGTGPCSFNLASATVVLGGPPLINGTIGDEVWEMLPSGQSTWTCPQVPDSFAQANNAQWVSSPTTEQYLRKPDTDKPSPLLDSYPRAIQLSNSPSGLGQPVFIAGDTRTVGPQGKPFDPVYGVVRDGKEVWTAKVPYTMTTPWELWKNSFPLELERDYGNAVILFRWDPIAGALVHNRVLVFGGQQWAFDSQTQAWFAQSVTGTVREFRAGGDAAAGSWHSKTSTIPRVFSNAVLLPDGTICLVGGTSIPVGNPPSTWGAPVFTPEIYDPGNTHLAAGSSTTMAASNTANWGPQTRVPRLYHSMAFLLPDATVFVIGGRIEQNPASPQYSDSRLSGEIFYPPYLFESGSTLATQPLITSAPGSTVFSTEAQDFTFLVEATAYGGTIEKVTLVRPSSVTHHFDSDQRFIDLEFSTTGGTGTQTLTVTAPKDHMGPQGYHMLFVLERRSPTKLVPSAAKFVRFL